MKKIFVICGLFVFIFNLSYSQTLEIKSSGSEKTYFELGEGDYGTFYLSDNESISGDIVSLENGMITLSNYFVEKDIPDIEGYGNYLDNIGTKTLKIQEINSFYSFNKIRNIAPYSFIAGVLAFFLAPAISLDFNDFSNFNSQRYFKTTLVGFGFITVGFSINLFCKNKNFINVNFTGNPVQSISGTRSIEADFSIH